MSSNLKDYLKSLKGSETTAGQASVSRNSGGTANNTGVTANAANSSNTANATNAASTTHAANAASTANAANAASTANAANAASTANATANTASTTRAGSVNTQTGAGIINAARSGTTAGTQSGTVNTQTGAQTVAQTGNAQTGSAAQGTGSAQAGGGTAVLNGRSGTVNYGGTLKDLLTGVQSGKLTTGGTAQPAQPQPSISWNVAQDTGSQSTQQPAAAEQNAAAEQTAAADPGAQAGQGVPQTLQYPTQTAQPQPIQYPTQETLQQPHAATTWYDPNAVYSPTVTPLAAIERDIEAEKARLTELLDQWKAAAQQQSQQARDYAVQTGVNALQRNQEDAQETFRTQRAQIDADEARALDNLSIYNERRGDRGGVGAAQFGSVQNTAARNRLAVNQAQVKLATDTARQIADLRAQGEFQKADDLLELTQNYLSRLVSLEQWAAEYGMSVEQLNAQIRQWNQQYELQVASLMGSWQGMPTFAARQFNAQLGMQQAAMDAAYAGVYNGMPTLAAQQWEQQRALQEAAVTGLYNGLPTLAAQQWEQQNALNMASLTGSLNGQPTVAVLSSLAEAGLALAQQGITPSESQLAALQTLYGYTPEMVEEMVLTAQIPGGAYQTAFEKMFADGINSTIDAVDWLQRHEEYAKWSYEEKTLFAQQYAIWLRRQANGQGGGYGYYSGIPGRIGGTFGGGAVSSSSLNQSYRDYASMASATGATIGTGQANGANFVPITTREPS